MNTAYEFKHLGTLKHEGVFHSYFEIVLGLFEIFPLFQYAYGKCYCVNARLYEH